MSAKPEPVAAKRQSNSLTLYNNGIGSFQRTFDVNAGANPTSIKLKVPVTAKGDLISSLRILGNKVTVVEPVSWPQESSSPLSISSDNVLLSLLSGLAGRKISIVKTTHGQPNLEGILIGTNTVNKQIGAGNSTAIIPESSVSVLSNGQVLTMSLSEVKGYTFAEPEVQAEINKALTQASLKLQKDTTVFSVGVVSKEKDSKETQQVTLQYSMPFPSWQPTYRLSLFGENLCAFEGVAKIDYVGEDDLPDCQITLVVGDPDTFATDLANPVIPRRNTINLAKTYVDGGYSLEEGVRLQSAPAVPASASRYSMKSAVRAGGYPTDDSTSLQQCAAGVGNSFGMELESANAPQTTTAEIGDYSTWTTKSPLTLRAKQSCLIPLFNEEVKNHEPTLYYNSSVNASRPKSGIQFTNKLPQSLGKGVCSIYQDNELIGTAVLNSVKSGNTIIMTYATENSVKVQNKVIRSETKLYSLVVKDGVSTLKRRSYSATVYTFDNTRDQAFSLTMDHTSLLYGSDLTCTVGSDKIEQTESLQTGGRYKFPLVAGRTEVKIEETTVHSSETILGESQSLEQFLIILQEVPEEGLKANKTIQAIVDIQKQLAAEARNVNSLTEENTQLSQTTARVIEYSKTPNIREADRNKWQDELAAAASKISENEVKLNTSRKTTNELREKLIKAAGEIQLTWNVAE